MAIDLIDLRAFYASRLGQVARRVLRAKIRAAWPNIRERRLLGFGFPAPYLGPFRGDAERVIAFMPAAQGVSEWPRGGPAAASLVEEDMWPLPDELFDSILLVHALESVDSADELLRECHRCLAPGGRLLAVVPNRRGPWARLDNTPFGHGRPFSRSQLGRLLQESAFEPQTWADALLFPPLEAGVVLRSAITLERFGVRFWSPFAGVHLVEAVKEVRQAIPARRNVARKAPAPAHAPVLVPGTASPAMPPRRAPIPAPSRASSAALRSTPQR
jgi:SAM-dependent methyltransferase